MKKKWMVFLMIVVLCGALGAFWENEWLEALYSPQAFWDNVLKEANQFSLVPLNELVPAKWEKAYIFTLYQSADTFYKAAGYKWRTLFDHGHENRYTFIFMEGDRVVLDYQGPEQKITFLGRSGTVHSADEPMMLLYPDGNGTDMALCPNEVTAYLAAKHTPYSGSKSGLWREDTRPYTDNLVITAQGVMYMFASVENQGIIQLWGVIEESGGIKALACHGINGQDILNPQVKVLSEDESQISFDFSYTDREAQTITHSFHFSKQ